MVTSTLRPPGPRGRLLSGSLHDFLARRLEFLAETAREHGDLCSFRFGPRRVFLANHPDLIEQVLVTDARFYSKHFGARNYRPVLGNGLVTSEGDFWLRQRRMAQPAFNRDRLNSYAPAMVRLTETMLATRWQDGEIRDIHAEMSRLTSDIALKTLFDLDGGEERDAYSESIREVFRELSSRIGRIVRAPDWVPTPSNRRLSRSLGRLRGLVDGFIRRARERGTGDDLLSRFIQARDEGGVGMTDEQLRDEAMTMYLAGHETTALTLSWTWYALSQHPQIEDALTAEWSAVLGGRSPTADDLPRLPFTHHVVTESMRLYPPVYLVGREALVDRELGGFRVPRGTTVFMSQWVTHRDARFYDHPLEFRPQRWAAGLEHRIPRYAYFPFGGGPRVCIGNNFAMMEAVLILATIGQHWRFTLEPEPPVAFELGITLLPREGIPAKLQRRS